MMAGLPVEARRKVMSTSNDEDRGYWLCSAYREYYGVPNFQTNPFPAEAKRNYAHSLETLDLSEVITLIDALIEERVNG